MDQTEIPEVEENEKTESEQLHDQIVEQLARTRQEYEEIVMLFEQSELEVNKLTQRNSTATGTLQRVQSQFERVPREEIRSAYDAVLDAQVPQTTAVARGEADIEVEYDGVPVYQPVDGTDLVYIQNTGSTVLQSDGLYYLVEDGVWYVSASPNGPWQVSTQRPAQVDTILPTSPVYNVKYVQVYDSTPSVVYVGYTPGYYGSYVYHNTIFYGSGWYYQPWVSPHYYYPRYSTWGWNVSYNPWTGWNFGLSWGWGPFSVSYYSGGYWHQNHYWHHRHYGRWGPGHYRPRHYGRRGHGRDRYANHGDGRRDSGRRDGRRDNGRGDRDRDNGRGDRGRGRTEPIRPSELRRKANVRDANYAAKRDLLLADNSGKVYRKADRVPDRNAGRNEATRRSTRPDKGTKRRTMPVPPASDKGVGKNRDRANKGRSVRGSRQSTTIAPARPAQNNSRPVPEQQRSKKSGRNKSAPDQRAPRKSTQKSSGQRGRSNVGKRARVSRPKKL